jgi:hypothetical protein
MSTFNTKAIITTQATFNACRPTKNGAGTQATFVLNNKDRNNNETTTWINVLLNDDLKAYFEGKWKPGTDALITFTTPFDNYFVNSKDSPKGKVYNLSGILVSAQKIVSYGDKSSNANKQEKVKNSNDKFVEGNIDTDIEEITPGW